MRERVKNRFRDLKIFYKVLLACLSMTILISLVSGGITYFIASKIVLNKTIEQTQETIHQLVDNYDAFMELMNYRVNTIAFNETVQEELREEEDEETKSLQTESYYSRARRVNRLLVQMFYSIQMEDIEIYGEGNRVYFCSANDTDKPFLENEDKLIESARNEKGGIVYYNDLEESGCIQVVKQIKDNLTMTPLGVLRIGVRTSALERIQKDINFGSEGKVLLLDQNNEIILGDHIELSKQAEELFTDWYGNFQYEENNETYQIVYAISEDTGWKTVGIFPREVITNSTSPVQLATIASVTTGIILSIILSILMSRMMSNPIRKTVGALKDVSKGDFSVRLEDARKDEYGELNQEFNHTIEQMENLLDEISESRLLNKEMEFKALQAQINPHFLYNALDTVSWMARAKGEEDISDLVTAVSKLLRISISNKEEMFTIEKELLYVKDYLYIQKTRYKNRFEVQYTIDNRILSHKVPKLTLQPIVENAIVHSVEMSSKKTMLHISGYMEGEDIYLEIEDTGIGMEKETLDHLLKPSKEKVNLKTTHTGLGLYAVDQRLKYLFGDDYGITATSVLGEGTTIKVRIKGEA
ncbi:cache domain-containing sensor histidine kinase [Aequitasia blattaphilus]|uniref:histidine kinase n=1 Tax=Aequitasia blattaphilus TaxID=2949332 RepID=A0ABT1E945_9FIRM|nr:histidine kinase [Aequitasia blattaphilus]MCP1102340.1 histidine kinase [Aequitasia blattaphilus]MCR8614980.1 histidine kinase [Aequitasia blattaphilus]